MINSFCFLIWFDVFLCIFFYFDGIVYKFFLCLLINVAIGFELIFFMEFFDGFLFINFFSSIFCRFFMNILWWIFFDGFWSKTLYSVMLSWIELELINNLKTISSMELYAFLLSWFKYVSSSVLLVQYVVLPLGISL